MRGTVTQGVFASDFHAPFHDPRCVALWLGWCAERKPEQVLLGGDVADLFTISRFAKIRPKYNRLVDELAVCTAEILEPIRSTLPKADIIFLEGNHEHRLKVLLATPGIQALEGLAGTTIQEALELDRLRIKFVGSKAGNAIFEITPHLTAMHGELYGANPAQAHVLKWGGSVIHGHTHRRGTFEKRFGNGKEWVGFAAGAMCKREDYRAIQDSSRGFVSYWFDEEGHFHAQHERIFEEDGTFYLTSGRDEWYAQRYPKAPGGFRAVRVPRKA